VRYKTSTCNLYSSSGSGAAGAGSMLDTPPSLSTAPRSPVTSATPSTPVVSLYTADSSADTSLSTVGCVYFANTFLLSGMYLQITAAVEEAVEVTPLRRNVAYFP